MPYKNKNVNFITYADCNRQNPGVRNYKRAKKRIIKEANKSNFFDTIKGYDYYSLSSEFKKKYDRTLKQPRGGGYWIWKYKIIQERLSELNDGDFLIYCDAGCTINPNGSERFYEYLDMLDDSEYGIIFNEQQKPESVINRWTIKEIFYYFNEKPENSIGLRRCCTPGCLFIQKKPHIHLILDEFEKLLEYDQKLITDYYNKKNQYNFFRDNRHDQSIFTFLFIKYGAIHIDKDEINGNDKRRQDGSVVGKLNPFWATRMRGEKSHDLLKECKLK